MPTVIFTLLCIIGIAFAVLVILLIIHFVRLSIELRKVEKSRQRAIIKIEQSTKAMHRSVRLGAIITAFSNRKHSKNVRKSAQNERTHHMAKGSKFVLGAAIGAAAGVVAGILTAPKSGKETRADIKKKAGEVKDKTVQSVDKLRHKTDKAADDVKDSLK